MDRPTSKVFGLLELPATQPRRIPHSLAREIEAAYTSREKEKRRLELAPHLPPSTDIDAYLSFSSHLKASKRVVALLGAGLSVASGIETYMGEGAFWRGHDVRKLASKELFEQDPALIWWLYAVRRREALVAKPNRGHHAVAALANKMGEEMLTVSQNIDDLSLRAKQPSSSTIYLHGSMFSIKCSSATCPFRSRNTKDPIIPSLTVPTTPSLSDPNTPLPEIPRKSLPKCPQCSSLLRPAVTWFNEALQQGAIELIKAWLGPEKPGQPTVDLILVIGTSGMVHPAAAIVSEARRRGARVCVINPDPQAVELIGGVDEQDWWFKGNAEDIVPAILKEAIGCV